MPFVLACLKCGARLRAATRLRAGRRLTCPTCRAAFTLHADAEPEARKAETIPDAVLLDDEDDRPPVGTRRRRDHVEDERPIRRRRRPVSPPLLLGVGIGGFFILLALGTGAYFLFRKASAPAAADLIAYAPSDTVSLAGFDLDALTADERLHHAIGLRNPADLAELDRAGLRPTDLSRALVARTGTGVAAALRFKGPQDRAKYLGTTVPGKPYAPLTSLNGAFRFGYFADAKTLVLADREATVQDVIDGGGKPRASHKLQALADRARGPMWRATGKTSPFDRPRFGLTDENWLVRFGPTAGSVAWLEPGGLLTDVRYEIDFDNRGQAMAAAGTLRGLFAVRRGMNEAGLAFGRDIDPADAADARRGYEGAVVTEDGLSVSAQLRLPATEAVKAVEALRP